jgi:hypothetical protein
MAEVGQGPELQKGIMISDRSERVSEWHNSTITKLITPEGAQKVLASTACDACDFISTTLCHVIVGFWHGMRLKLLSVELQVAGLRH